MSIFVARQPILDLRNDLFSYELLFRESTDNYFQSQDGDLATSAVITNSFFLMNIEQITKGKRAFINFTSNLIKRGIPTLLPKDSTVIEILEDVEPDQELLASFRKLKGSGYLFALDDFVFRQDYRPLIDLADFIKVDFQATNRIELFSLIRRINNPKIKFIAEKVETIEEFEEAKKYGFTLFQGYYFSQPTVLKSKKIPSNKVNYLRLLKEIHNPFFRIEVIEQFIKEDVSLTYMLLKFINSSVFGLKSQISSIRQALVLLGPVEFRKWVSVIVLGTLSQGKPGEIAVQSYVRATFLERLAPVVGISEQASPLFLMGLFSLIDACLDRPLQEILLDLPIDEAVKNALLGFPNGYRTLLELVIAYEQGNWHEVGRLAKTLQIAESQIPPCYLGALELANRLLKEEAS